MKQFAIALVIALISSLALSAIAEARGRTGSHRSGGYNSHGKGSHYYGGR